MKAGVGDAASKLFTKLNPTWTRVYTNEFGPGRVVQALCTVLSASTKSLWDFRILAQKEWGCGKD